MHFKLENSEYYLECTMMSGWAKQVDWLCVGVMFATSPAAYSLLDWEEHFSAGVILHPALTNGSIRPLN